MHESVPLRPRLLCVVAIAVLTAASCGVAPSEPPEIPSSPNSQPPIQMPGRTVGVANDIPGFNQLVDPSTNTRAGFDYQFILWLGDHVDPPFTPSLVPILIEQRVPVIVNGSVDLVVNVLSITDEKKDEIGIAGPYLLTRQGVLTRASGPSISTLEDLHGRNICTVDGSTSELQLETLEDLRLITLTRELGNSGCADRLRQNSVEVFSTDQLVLSAFAAQSEGEFTVSTFTFGSAEEYGIGYPKGDIDTCRSLRKAIREFVIENRWHDYFISNFPDLAEDEAAYRPDINNLDECSE